MLIVSLLPRNICRRANNILLMYKYVEKSSIIWVFDKFYSKEISPLERDGVLTIDISRSTRELQLSFNFV